MDARAETPRELSGDINADPLHETLQRLERARATGSLRILGAAITGEFLLREGKVVLARTNHRSGEDAAIRLLWLKAGRYEFRKLAQVEAPHGPGWPVGRLVTDAAWLYDELVRLGHRAPGVRDRVEVASREAAARAFPGSGAWANLVENCRVPISVEDLASDLGVSTYRCRAMLARAAETGAVRILPGR